MCLLLPRTWEISSLPPSLPPSLHERGHYPMPLPLLGSPSERLWCPYSVFQTPWSVHETCNGKNSLISKPCLSSRLKTNPSTDHFHQDYMMMSFIVDDDIIVCTLVFNFIKKFDNKYRIGWVQSSLWIAQAHIIHSMRNYSILIYCYVCAGTHRIVPVTLNAYCTGGNIHHRIRMGLL